MPKSKWLPSSYVKASASDMCRARQLGRCRAKLIVLRANMNCFEVRPHVLDDRQDPSSDQRTQLSSFGNNILECR